MEGADQRQSVDDYFVWLCIISIHHKTKILPENRTSPLLCRAEQETGSVDTRSLAAISWKSTTSFLTYELGNTKLLYYIKHPNLLTWHGSMWFLTITQAKPWHWKVFNLSYKNYVENAVPGVLYSQRNVSELLPTMAGILGDVCVVPKKLLWRKLKF